MAISLALAKTLSSDLTQQIFDNFELPHSNYFERLSATEADHLEADEAGLWSLGKRLKQASQSSEESTTATEPS